MKKEITYAQLHQLASEITMNSQTSMVFGLFNQEKIERFFSRNRLRLESLDNKMKALRAKYVVHDEKGAPMTVEETDETGKQKSEWVFVSHVADKDGLPIIGLDPKEEYYRESNEFLNRSLSLEF